MQATKVFEANEVLTLVSGVVVFASWLWMKRTVPSYRLEHLNSPGPLLGLVQAYRQSPRPMTEKLWVTAAFRIALTVFLVSAVASFAVGFVAAVRGPAKPF